MPAHNRPGPNNIFCLGAAGHMFWSRANLGRHPRKKKAELGPKMARLGREWPQAQLSPMVMLNVFFSILLWGSYEPGPGCLAFASSGVNRRLWGPKGF